MRQGRGFTLIELLLVVTIVTIILAGAIPSLSRLVEQQRVKSAAYDFYRELMFMRTEANLRSKRVALTYKGDSWTSGWQVFVDNNQNGELDADEIVLHEHDSLNAKTKIKTGKKVGNYIGYNKGGDSVHADNSFFAETLTFCSSNPQIQSIRITISITGRARMSTLDAATSPCKT